MAMSSTKQWASGDKIVHCSKPEWGTGVITAAAGSQHEGKPCQSLTVRFDRAGIKVLSTAFAHLMDAELAPSLHRAPPLPTPQPSAPTPSIASSRAQGPASILEIDEASPLVARDPREIMTRLPEIATDPFTTPAARLKATLAIYRFTPTGSSLLDWAAVQSGLADPMSRFNRHELERFFEAFAVVRDNHLKKLVIEIKRTDPSLLSQTASQAPPAAKLVLRRLDALR